MFWDENFWESLIINYLGSLGAAVTLILLGLGGYEIYVYIGKKRKKLKKIK